jgi:hypothetical protein
MISYPQSEVSMILPPKDMNFFPEFSYLTFSRPFLASVRKEKK